jgi:hypothetical protein
MAIKKRYSGIVYHGTLAEFTATTRPYALGCICLPSDSDEIRVADGLHAFADLTSMPAQALQKSAKIAAIGALSITAIAATYADLAAARTSVNALKTDTQTSITAIQAKVDALIAALIAGGLMSNT